MRLPRRTPWKDLSEIEELCQQIYGPAADLVSRMLALQTLNAWRANTSLPHALEITASLLVVMIDDVPLAEVTSSSHLGLRQSYALAIVRLVNNLVDPFQQGMYARPIASIAAQIGLPGWLVEIRHQATHEELPSLNVLREAAQEGLTWLLPNFFLPTTSSSIDSARQHNASPSLLPPLLLGYKNSAKAAVGVNLSDRRPFDVELDRLGREIDRWIDEVGVAYPNRSTVEMSDAEGAGSKEWVLAQLCEALVAKGGLVPVSKKKRSQPTSKIANPPSVAIWSPLLKRIQLSHLNFAAQLMATLTEVFEHSDREGISYKWSIIEWIAWMSETFGPKVEECSPNATVKSLLAIVGGGSLPSDDITLLKALIKTLAASDEDLRSGGLALANTFENLSPLHSSNGTVDDADLELMERRLRRVGSTLQCEPSNLQSSRSASKDQVMDAQGEIAPGWTLRTKSNWKPTPMGIFVP